MQDFINKLSWRGHWPINTTFPLEDIISGKIEIFYININHFVTYPPARFFWSSIFGDLDWRKAWRTVDQLFVNNKVKEVSYKILHRIYPVKHVLERFKLNIETILHLFFHCIYTKIFWVDVENFITRKLNTAVKLGGSDIMIYVDDYGIEKDKAYIIQLLVIILLTNLNNTIIRYINVKQKKLSGLLTLSII